MTDYTNNYFLNMRDIGINYENAKISRLQKKEEILKSKNNEDALAEWYEREKSSHSLLVEDKPQHTELGLRAQKMKQSCLSATTSLGKRTCMIL